MRSIILLSMLFFALGCAKDGETGPQGAQGDKGEQGIPGKDGSTILSGTSDPDTSIGKDGDFYLNMTSGNLFGPKSSGDWGTPYTMKGDKGDPGTNGNTILSGEGEPSSALGNNGDFYVNLVDYTIYGPKVNSGWGDPVSLKPDRQNGLIVYKINPSFNQDFTATKLEEHKYRFSGKTKNYLIEGKENKIIEFYYVIVSRYDDTPEISSTLWKRLGNSVELGQLIQSLEIVYEDVELEFAEVRTVDNNFTFNFSVSGYSNVTLTGTMLSGLTILVRAYEVEKIETLSKTTNNVKRYLRVQD